MSKPYEYESWLVGVLNKYPDEVLSILSRLCAVGLARGECSANDLTDFSYTHPPAVGAAFKVLKRVGFVKSDRITTCNRKGRHAGLVLIWTLTDASKAERFLSECRAVLVRQEKQEQMLMAM